MWQYYLDVTKFNLAFCLFCLVFLSPFYAALMFGTLGNAIGFLGYRQFHKNEYYTYYNLGFTKRKLVMTVSIINLLICIPLLGLVTLIAVIF